MMFSPAIEVPGPALDAEGPASRGSVCAAASARSPVAIAKLCSTKASAAAANAPATTGVQSKPTTVPSASGAARVSDMVTARSFVVRPGSAQAEDGQDGHDHDDEADEIDETVHECVLAMWDRLRRRVARQTDGDRKGSCCVSHGPFVPIRSQRSAARVAPRETSRRIAAPALACHAPERQHISRTHCE